jgi:2-methylisocitrate lyase-like PEP mutase family enzyme
LELNAASERVRAAAEAVRALSFPFMLTARAENYLYGRNDLSDTIRRLQTYQEAGADVLYAPGLSSLDEIASVVKSVDRPVNVIAGSGTRFTIALLARAGVRRVSVGSALSRTALTAFLNASREMITRGTFDFAADAVSYGELNGLFEN